MDGRILIVDDVATNRIVFKVKLGAACYSPSLAADGESCLRMARDEAPDLILLDLMLPDMTGIEVLQRLRADAATCDIPVVMFSASPDPAARIAAFRAGADEFLTKPIDDQTLLARVRGLLRAREPLQVQSGVAAEVLGLAEPAAAFDGPGVIALVTTRAETAMRWRKDLTAALTDRIVVLTREEALADGTAARRGPVPDVFVIDSDLGGDGGGLRLMSDLRSRGTTRNAAICIVRTRGTQESVAMAFDLGANDAVDADFDPSEMALRLQTLLRRKRKGDRARGAVEDGLRLAVIDPLTGLYNRRYALPHLAGIAERAVTDGTRFAVMVVDLDRFKLVNDRWGHAAGDAVLVEVARRLSANLRSGDMLARIGGEEFLAALPDTTYAEAQAAAERLRSAVTDAPIMVPGGQSLTITISIGLAIGGLAIGGLAVGSPAIDGAEGPDRWTEPVAATIDRADRALLVAKAEGRNQVTISRSAA